MSRTALLRGLHGARHALPARSPFMGALPSTWDERAKHASPAANMTQLMGPGLAGSALVSARSFASYPTAETAADMQLGNEFFEMDNETITLLAAQGDVGATTERLTREIMAVDEVSWDEATVKVDEMKSALNAGLGMRTLPQKVFIGTLIVGGLATFPLCFDLTTAKVFNDACVTADVADPEDLETWLEVGAWTWNWMEPPLGQLSFFILCLDFARAQLNNLGLKPYVEKMVAARGSKLASAYPKYHNKILTDFATCNGLKPF
mmetsp:Transcript_29458/g.68382  ORF Transcript_29458/g.68382 Transcript_29458/m.68382 type:complete len:264 (-) Transcript_29458:120-911(-)|eukprot:CAMPEP_0182573652 /NCGR_PEP_ID=MMETSP1324-20130603/20339_1 /TAXON_ID=236786 /ORGANISM="Florenciella sp., Strain RCC1587" /LENGTH=263 /DNA_ID=CAMNT_0024788791 /DNA_START=45 /DNA_END=836 /DNA_ORIENTATION=+